MKTLTLSVPNKLNLTILLLSSCISICLLKFATETHSILLFAICGILFSFSNNTLFSIMHEAIHKILNSNSFLNEVLGCFAAAFFPTSFVLQRSFHLGHHKRNRSDDEIFDLYYPTDNILIKKLQIYFILSGLYWVTPVIAALFCFVFPKRFILFLVSLNSKLTKKVGLDAMLKSIPIEFLGRIKLEVLFAIFIQFFICQFAEISLDAWLFCYFCFAVNWGGQQYTNHAFTERDTVDGAWNFKVNPIIEKIFLNFHLHKAHHQHPSISWIHLKAFVKDDEERPSFWRIYREFMKGPKPESEFLQFWNKS